MRTKLLHGLLSGVVIALVLGFFLVPSTWHLIGQNGQFGPPVIISTKEVIGIIASVAVISVILLSFVLMRRLEE